MSVVRETPTPLERTLLNLDERIDRLGGLTDLDVLPTPQQTHEVSRGLERLHAQLGRQVRGPEAVRVEALMNTASAQWREAVTATHYLDWQIAAEATGETLSKLSAAIGEASGRPSVLSATREDVEAILARAIKREESKPGKHEFYELPRLHVPGFPTEAFGRASQAVAAALALEGFGDEEEPPLERRLPILRAASAQLS